VIHKDGLGGGSDLFLSRRNTDSVHANENRRSNAGSVKGFTRLDENHSYFILVDGDKENEEESFSVTNFRRQLEKSLGWKPLFYFVPKVCML